MSLSPPSAPSCLTPPCSPKHHRCPKCHGSGMILEEAKPVVWVCPLCTFRNETLPFVTQCGACEQQTGGSAATMQSAGGATGAHAGSETDVKDDPDAPVGMDLIDEGPPPSKRGRNMLRESRFGMGPSSKAELDAMDGVRRSKPKGGAAAAGAGAGGGGTAVGAGGAGGGAGAGSSLGTSVAPPASSTTTAAEPGSGGTSGASSGTPAAASATPATTAAAAGGGAGGGAGAGAQVTAASGGAGDDGADEQRYPESAWRCEHCTYINTYPSNTCSVCHGMRTKFTTIFDDDPTLKPAPRRVFGGEEQAYGASIDMKG